MKIVSMRNLSNEDVLTIVHTLKLCDAAFQNKKTFVKRRMAVALALKKLMPAYREALRETDWNISEKAAAVGAVGMIIQNVLGVQA